MTHEEDEVEEARDERNPAAQAIDDLWRAVILAHKPDYGDWEYPGQAYRHILAEFNELRERLLFTTNERDDAEMALRVLLARQRAGKSMDLERYAHIAMRHASPLREEGKRDE